MNEVLERIEEMLEERGWTKYRLAKESHIAYSSLNGLFQKNNQPTIPTLRKICKGFNISISDFFAYDESNNYIIKLSDDEIELLKMYNSLDNKHKHAIYNLLKSLV